MTHTNRWLGRAAFVLSLIGLGISAYLTFTHYAGSAFLACSDTGVVNCATVTSSPQSVVFGVPVAVAGLGAYVLLSILNSPWMWRSTSAWVQRSRLALTAGSMVFVLWLVAAELLIIDHICLWCTGVHVVTFSLLLVSVYAASAERAQRSAAIGSSGGDEYR
jgi:uncharacterized membrane protein